MPKEPQQNVSPSPGFLERLFSANAPVKNPPLPPAPHDLTVNLPPFMQRAVTNIQRQGLSPTSNPRFQVPELGSQEHLDMTRGTATSGPMGAQTKFSNPGVIRVNPALAHGINTPEEQMNRTMLHEMSHRGMAANANPLYKARVFLEDKLLPHGRQYEENRAGLEAEQLLAKMRAMILARQQRQSGIY